jgi:hypothetical protein
MNRTEAIEAVLEVLKDGQRIDRYLRMSATGDLYLTDTEWYEGPHNESDHYIHLSDYGGDTDITDSELEEEALALVGQLEDEIETCPECCAADGRDIDYGDD